tara:strand:+ start:7090 stop:7422 length:333 start_codon:yes stop_codon:yes gene_type:complete
MEGLKQVTELTNIFEDDKGMFTREDIFKNDKGEYYKFIGKSRDMQFAKNMIDFDVKSFSTGDSTAMKDGRIIPMKKDEVEKMLMPKKSKSTEDNIMDSWIKSRKIFGGIN